MTSSTAFRPAPQPSVPAPRPPWGMLAAIDVEDCDRSALADPERLRALVRDVIDAIGMRAHGPLHLERFGDGDLEGWSAMQFIETSSVTLHADEVGGRLFLDVFSCVSFDGQLAAAVVTRAFPGRARVSVLQRG